MWVFPYVYLCTPRTPNIKVYSFRPTTGGGQNGEPLHKSCAGMNKVITICSNYHLLVCFVTVASDVRARLVSFELSGEINDFIAFCRVHPSHFCLTTTSLSVAEENTFPNMSLYGKDGGKTDVYKMLTSMQKFERPVALKANGRSNFCI